MPPEAVISRATDAVAYIRVDVRSAERYVDGNSVSLTWRDSARGHRIAAGYANCRPVYGTSDDGHFADH